MKNRYLDKKYNHRARWTTYFIQWRTISDVLPEGGKILEVGIGSGIVAEQLKKMGYEVITADNNSDVKPDYVADILKLPFEDSHFDLVLAAEILEHLDFKKALEALQELKRVSRKFILISVPDRRRILISFKIKVPFLKEKKILIKLPTSRKKLFSPEHKWEIGYKNFSPKYVREKFLEQGLKIKGEFVSIDAPHIHYFLFTPLEIDY